MATRTLVSLGDERLEKLDALAREHGRSRSALVRDAIDLLIAERGGDQKQRMQTGLDAAFGLWANRDPAFDPQTYERHRRAEWTRPWDDDYEEVRAESPECFDEEDDRQRQIYLDMLQGKYPEAKYPSDS